VCGLGHDDEVEIKDHTHCSGDSQLKNTLFFEESHFFKPISGV
jgi:hypothetical protein